MKNPVMFVVEIGSLVTTIDLIYGVTRTSARILLRAANHAMAVVHSTLCKFCGGHGGRAWKSAGGYLA